MDAHARVGDKGDDVDDLTGAGVDECLVPFARLLVLDLYDMSEDDMVGVLGKILCT